MPLIMCIYCGYVGGGHNVEERVMDVHAHEKRYHKEELAEDAR